MNTTHLDTTEDATTFLKSDWLILLIPITIGRTILYSTRAEHPLYKKHYDAAQYLLFELPYVFDMLTV